VIVYVARHGETDWNLAGRYQGQRESDLTERGRRQARALATALSGGRIEAVYSSPLRRCRQSAADMAAAYSLPVRTDGRLIEIAHGVWEGRLRETIERDDADRYALWRNRPDEVVFPAGESLLQVRERWRAFAAEVEGYDEAAVVTHDVLVRLAILDATGRGAERLWEPRVINGGYARFEVRDGRWTLLDECKDGHLNGLLVDVTGQAL
jgi:broad specificity phosphatase PhoE